MEIVKYNNVFNHVETSLIENFGIREDFKNVVFVLGYNCWKNLDFVRQKYPKHKMIVVQLEQLFRGSKWWNKEAFNTLKKADEVWDYEISNIKFLHQYKIFATHFPMPYTDSLKILPPIDKATADIDVLFYGYANDRRMNVLVDLQANLGKLKIITLFNVWGSELDSYLNRSKIILNTHYYKESIQEQVRMYYPVINGRCVLSEKSINNYFGNAIIECPYDEILLKTADLIKTGRWFEQANKSAEIFKNITNS
jgi:hypothetical protein